MKTWTNPEIKEMMLSETQYGGTELNTVDYTYQNDEGVWEGKCWPLS